MDVSYPQSVFYAARLALPTSRSPPDAKDCADRHGAIDVGAAIKGVENNNVFTCIIPGKRWFKLHVTWPQGSSWHWRSMQRSPLLASGTMMGSSSSSLTCRQCRTAMSFQHRSMVSVSSLAVHWRTAVPPRCRLYGVAHQDGTLPTASQDIDEDLICKDVQLFLVLSLHRKGHWVLPLEFARLKQCQSTCCLYLHVFRASKTQYSS